MEWMWILAIIFNVAGVFLLVTEQQSCRRRVEELHLRVRDVELQIGINESRG